MDTEGRLGLIRRNTEEVVTEEELQALAKKKMPRAYIGFAPTGRLHIGYYLPAIKIKDFIDAGFEVTFLIADLHAHLDDLKSPWKLLDARSEYYEKGIRAILKSIGADPKKVKFVRGSSFQKKEKYAEEMLRMAAMVTLSRAKRAAAEVVRFGEEPKLGGFIYPVMQALDVAALKADVAFGGIDQRGNYMLARELLPELGYAKPTCVFTPLMPGLTGAGKMSASVPQSKVDIFDPAKEVEQKIMNAFCPIEVKDNGLLAFMKHVVFRLRKKLDIERDAKYGGNVSFGSYEELEAAYIGGKLHPMDLKKAAVREINSLLGIVQKEFKDHELVKRAYP
ncbi:MAG: tyrosine--tRNA ligase [Candidatus Aenigmatarchaeota archaeon]